MIGNGPVFMYERKETIHQIGHLIEVGRNMIPDQNRFFAIPTTKLGNVSHCSIVQSPKRVLVEGLNPLVKTYF